MEFCANWPGNFVSGGKVARSFFRAILIPGIFVSFGSFVNFNLHKNESGDLHVATLSLFFGNFVTYNLHEIPANAIQSQDAIDPNW